MSVFSSRFGFVVDSIINELNRQYELNDEESKRIMTEKMYRQVNGQIVRKDIAKPSIDQRVKFMYFGNTNKYNDHNGIITVATLVDEEEKTVSFGVSYCSPDDGYDKNKGKKIAYDRLNQDEATSYYEKKTHKDILVRVLCNIIASNTYPSWAKRIIVENIQWNISHI